MVEAPTYPTDSAGEAGSWAANARLGDAPLGLALAAVEGSVYLMMRFCVGLESWCDGNRLAADPGWAAALSARTHAQVAHWTLGLALAALAVAALAAWQRAGRAAGLQLAAALVFVLLLGAVPPANQAGTAPGAPQRSATVTSPAGRT
ncbi:hypothetical protein [Kitasatospora sp. LaBMicrA B282]|uniref:hypothetical protein n=1 Tax=Kitasatospora sp. LaBMicrA B282 TaxID=3420949 RepID=UPI003D13F33A